MCGKVTGLGILGRHPRWMMYWRTKPLGSVASVGWQLWPYVVEKGTYVVVADVAVVGVAVADVVAEEIVAENAVIVVVDKSVAAAE